MNRQEAIERLKKANEDALQYLYASSNHRRYIVREHAVAEMERNFNAFRDGDFDAIEFHKGGKIEINFCSEEWCGRPILVTQKTCRRHKGDAK